MRERTTDRMSAPSSPTTDIHKMESPVQASLSLPGTPVGPSPPFVGPKGQPHQPHRSIGFFPSNVGLSLVCNLNTLVVFHLSQC